MRNKCLFMWFSIGILLAITSTIGLGITIKYAYLDELKYYHTDSCHVNKCSSTPGSCCTTKYPNTQTCRGCYYINIDYELLLNNTQVYSKTDTIKIYDNDAFCTQESVICYYYDRNILQSLNLLKKLSPDGGMVGIVLLSTLLFLSILIMIAVLSVIIVSHYIFNNEPLEDSNSD